MIPTFDRNYWINQLTKEVGLEGVPYDKLSEHTVNFSSFFDLEKDGRRNAKEYVDSELLIIEEKYKQIEQTTNEMVSDSDFEDLMSINLNPTNEEIPQLVPVVQEVHRNKYRYFEVEIGENTFLVVINQANGDWRIQDQINHLVNTTFFIEEKKEEYLTGSERAITYYQFANAIQPYLKQRNDLSIFDDITQTVVFDGVKLPGFND